MDGDAADLTVSEIAERYLQTTAHKKSVDDSARHLARFVDFIGKSVFAKTVKAADIERWLHHEAGRSSQATANRALHVVRATFRKALRDEKVDKDPTFAVKPFEERQAVSAT